MPMLLMMSLVGLRQSRLSERTVTIVAIVANCVLFSLFSLSQLPPILAICIGSLVATIYVLVLVRFGLLAMVVTVYCGQIIGPSALTLDPGRWWFGYSTAALILVFAIAAHGLNASLRGRTSRA